MSKGIIYNLISRLIFIFGAYAIHIYLARLLCPEKYGVFGVCIAVITICYVFLNNGVRQIVSKSSAKFPESAKYFLKKGITVQLTISTILGLLIIIFSKNIAFLFNDNDLIKPLYLSGIIIIIQSLYFVYTGTLNGLKKFGCENAVLSAYGFIRPVVAILLLYLSFEVMGALTGFLIASISAVILGIILTWKLGSKRHDAIKVSNILKSSIPIMVIFGGITIIMNFDLLSVKHFMPQGQFSGYYTSAAAISKLSYWFLFAFGSVLLPFVTSSFHKNDIKQTRKYINEIIRYSLLIVLPVVFLLSFYADNAVCLIYGAGYQPAGNVLKILIFGLANLGLISIFSHIMIGINRETLMIGYSLIGIITAIVLNIILIPRIGMIGGAISTTISAGIVAILSYSFIKRRLKIKLNVVSIVKVIGSIFLMLLIAYGINGVEVNFVIKAVVLYLGYFLFLLLFKEINNDDVNVVKNLVLSFSTKDQK
jgi:O-antigen/teichoic acid export membrane protein